MAGREYGILEKWLLINTPTIGIEERNTSEIEAVEEMNDHIAVLKRELNVEKVLSVAEKKMNGTPLPEIVEVVFDGMGQYSGITRIKGITVLNRVKFRETGWEYCDGDVGQREGLGRIPGPYQIIDWLGIQLKVSMKTGECGVVLGLGEDELLQMRDGGIHLFRRMFSYDATHIGFNFEDRDSDELSERLRKSAGAILLQNLIFR